MKKIMIKIFFLFFLLKQIFSEETYATIESDTINSGSQVISFLIKENDFNQLAITSNGYFIKFYSDSSRTLPEQKTGFDFDGISSDACQISKNLAVLVKANQQKIIIFDLSGTIKETLNLGDFDNNSITLSCSYGNDIFSVAYSKNKIATITWYNSNSLIVSRTISNIIDNHISCAMFVSKKYTVCFYTNDTYRQNSFYSLYDENNNIKKDGNVNSIGMEHKASNNEQITENYGTITKRLEDDKVMYCELKNLAWHHFQLFCNVGLLNVSNTNILYKDSNQADYAVLDSVSNDISHCFIGIRSDGIFPTTCRYNQSNIESSISVVSFVTYSDKKFKFLKGSDVNDGTNKINITSNKNSIINIIEFNNEGVGYLFSEGNNIKYSLYFPNCSSSLSDNLNKYPSTSTCQSKDSTIEGYYYDSLYHKFIQISTGATSCTRNLETLELVCVCDNSNDYYNVPNDYEGNDECWNKSFTYNYYYFDSNTFKHCKAGCLVCTSSTDCLKCDNPTTLSSTTNYFYPIPPTGTIEKCINKETEEIGYYFINENNGFGKCNSSCRTCSKTSSSPSQLCIDCKTDYSPKNISSSPNLECLLTLGTHENWFLNISVFMECDETCKFCSRDSMSNETNKCTACKNNYFPLADTNNGISSYLDCRNSSTKPTNTILVSDIYKYCNKACKTCTSIGSNEITNCTSEDCSHGFFPLKLDKTICIEKTKKENYYSNYYLNTNFGNYEKCNESCINCETSSLLCKECSSNYKPLYPFNVDGTKRCFNETTKSKMFYETTITIDSNSVNVYEICYHKCESCIKGGDETNNNCTKCTSEYVLNPEKEGQCELKCEENQYFYINSSLNYICVNECPINYQYLDLENSRCYHICPSTKPYSYEKKCITSCPSGTSFSDDNICVDGNKCLKSSYQISFSLTDIISEISLMISTYVEHYNSITTHVTTYKEINSEYIISIYKSEACLNELEPEIPIPDFSNCLKKIINSNSNLNENSQIIILLLYIKKTGQTEYKFYDNEGTELSKKICSGDKISMIVDIDPETEGIEEAKYFEKLGINVYNFSDPFFTDICFEFTAPNGRDVTLEDRKKNYYQNVSLCESDCELISVNLDTLEANCSCEIKEDFLNNVLDNAVTGEILEILNDANFGSIKCYKNVFDFNHFIKNIGSYVMLFSFFSQLPFLILYIKNGIIDVKINLLDYIKMNPPKKNNNPNITIDTNRNLMESESERGKKTVSMRRTIPKLKDDNVIIFSNRYSDNFENNISMDNNIDTNNYNDLDTNKDESKYIDSPDKFIINNTNKKLVDLVLNDNIEEESINVTNSNKNYESISFSDSLKKDNSNSINLNSSNNSSKNKIKLIPAYKTRNLRKIKKIKSKIQKEKKEKEEEEEEEIDDDELNSMELYDALLFDKRSFCEFYWQQIQEKQNIIRTFFNRSPFESFPIKIMIFIFEIALFFALNGIFYSLSYISERFYNVKGGFMFFFKNQIYRIIYATMCAEVINFLINFLTGSKDKIELLIKREKNNDTFRIEVVKVLKNMKRKYLIFIILNYIVIIFFWYFLSTFCNVYHNSQLDWFYGSLITFAVIEILPFIFCLFISAMRFLGLKCKMEGAYRLSQCLSD